MKDNPSGRLSNTWPASDAQLPNFTSYDMRASPGRTYQYLEPSTTPLYRFGAGLSYGETTFSKFDTSKGRVDAASIQFHFSASDCLPCMGHTLDFTYGNASQKRVALEQVPLTFARILSSL